MKIIQVPANCDTQEKALDFISKNVSIDGYEIDFFDGRLKAVEILGPDDEHEAHEMTFSTLSDQVGPGETREVIFE